MIKLSRNTKAIIVYVIYTILFIIFSVSQSSSIAAAIPLGFLYMSAFNLQLLCWKMDDRLTRSVFNTILQINDKEFEFLGFSTADKSPLMKNFDLTIVQVVDGVEYIGFYKSKQK